MESKPDKTREFMSLFQTKQPRTITKVIDRYGNFIGSFSAENRIWIAERDIPPIFKEGLIATEDGNFWNHDGVSFTSLVRAAKNFLISFGENRQQGGSTITMQLVRVVSNKREKKINRKIEEIKLALELEKRFSKEKILEMYCNEVYFGGSRYGIEAASQFYFSKSITELREEECALLIALIQSPEKYYKMLISGSDSGLLTVRNRRDYVLTKMYQANLIKSSDELEILKSKPMRVFELSSNSIKAGSYPLEEVRKDLYERFGREKAIEGGHLLSRAHLAKMLIRGEYYLGIDQNAKRAFLLVHDSALSGCHYCQEVLAFCYLAGIGCEKNIPKYLEFAKKSAAVWHNAS